MLSEETIYHAQNIAITPRQVVAGQTTFVVEAIQATWIAKRSISAPLTAVIGLLALVGGSSMGTCSGIFIAGASGQDPTTWTHSALAAIALGVCLLGTAKRLPPFRYVVYATIGGQAAAIYETPSCRQAQEIERAIARARGLLPSQSSGARNTQECLLCADRAAAGLKRSCNHRDLASTTDHVARTGVSWRSALISVACLPPLVWLLLATSDWSRSSKTSKVASTSAGLDAAASSSHHPSNAIPASAAKPQAYEDCAPLKQASLAVIKGRSFDQEAMRQHGEWREAFKECKLKAGAIEDEVQARSGVPV